MNNQSPLIPQGSLLEQKNRGRARVKVAVFLVLTIHGIGLLALLMQGCKKEPEVVQTTEPANNNTPVFVEPTNGPGTTAAATPGSNDFAGTTPAPTTSAEPPPPPVTTPPVTTPPPPPVSNAPGTEYKVAKGDSFSIIAKKLHVSVKAITEANPGVEPTKLKIGQTLHIPAATASTAPSISGSAPEASLGSDQLYTVKSGETLSKIASQHGVTTKALRAANNLKTDKIKVGQKLKIPAKSSTPTAAAASAPAAGEATPVAAASVPMAR